MENKLQCACIMNSLLHVVGAYIPYKSKQFINVVKYRILPIILHIHPYLAMLNVIFTMLSLSHVQISRVKKYMCECEFNMKIRNG